MKTTTRKTRPLMLTSLALAVAAALGMSATAMACPGGPGAGPGGGKFERMAERLDLSDKQRQQLKQIHRDARGEGMAIHDAMQDTREALHRLDPGSKDYRKRVSELAEQKAELVKQMIEHMSSVKAEVYAILTPEQRRKARELKTWRAERHQPGARAPRHF